MNVNKVSNRQAICETLMRLTENDKDIIVLTSDSRGSAGMIPFVEKYPQQHIETGIAEQNIVGIAAGMARAGKKPIVASPASFLTMRGIEQIKVDVAYSHTNVILLGVSGGLSYGALGMTHHSLQDIAALNAIPGIDIMIPADRLESVEIMEELMRNPRPAYVRIGRNAVPDVYREKAGYLPGKASVVHEGNDASIIATGETVFFAQQAAEILKKTGIFIRVLDMHTIKPFDVEAVKNAADTGFVLTMEEHSVFGGLGSIVAGILAQYRPTKMKILAIPDEPAVAGNSAEVFYYYGITAENAVRIIREAIRKNDV